MRRGIGHVTVIKSGMPSKISKMTKSTDFQFATQFHVGDISTINKEKSTEGRFLDHVTLIANYLECPRSYLQNDAARLVTGARNCERVTVQSYMSSISCQSDGGALKQQFWHTSVNMVRLHSICKRTVTVSRR